MKLYLGTIAKSLSGIATMGKELGLEESASNG